MTIRYPDKLCLALVDTCNLKCISCYSWKNKYKADPALDTALESFLTDFRKQVSLPYMVNFSGGETLINPKLAETDRKSTRLNSSHSQQSRMPSSA